MKIVKKMLKPKKSQIMGGVLKYGIVAFFSVIILLAGYKMVSIIREKACDTEMAKFEIELKGIADDIRFGQRELNNYPVPCGVEQIYFFDISKKIDSESFKDTPIMKDALKSGLRHNVFLIKNNDVMRSFYAGNFVTNGKYLCFGPRLNTISFFIEGAGTYVRLTPGNNQQICKTEEEPYLFGDELDEIDNIENELNGNDLNDLDSGLQDAQNI